MLSLPPLTEAQLRDTSQVLPDLAAAITMPRRTGTEAWCLPARSLPG